MTSKVVFESCTYGANHNQLPLVRDAQNFIDNKLEPSAATKWIEVHDPATNHVVSRTPESTAEELARAVESAQKAYPGWKATSIIKRQQILYRFTNLIRDHMDELAVTIVREQGKTLADARGDVLRGLQVCETSCGITTQLTGEILEVAKDMETRSYREPLGVAAAICPFNFPAMIPLWSLPIATVVGNCMIIKPSERDPGAALMIAELAREAGFPSGVINIIHGAKDAVDFILDEPTIRAISFVGSNRAGEYIYSRGTANGKRVQANMGAKNHAIVSPEASKEATLNAITGAAFGAAGQRCMALSTVILLGESKQWIPDLINSANNYTAGSGFDATADFGPVISPQSRERIESLIASAEKEGAKIVLDGRGKKPKGYPNGNWVGPTIITGIRPDMKCYMEEVFGPVLLCMEEETLDSAISLINANAWGNGAVIFTNHGGIANRFQHDIEAGQVGINVPIPVPLPMFSFTGNKRSVAGTGLANFYGQDGIRFYTQWKTVTSVWRHQEPISSGKLTTMG